MSDDGRILVAVSVGHDFGTVGGCAGAAYGLELHWGKLQPIQVRCNTASSAQATFPE